MKRCIVAIVLCLAALPGFGQTRTLRSIGVTAQSSDCSTAKSCVSLSKSANDASAIIQITGTFSATLQFEATADGSTWVSISGSLLDGSATGTSTTSTGAWSFSATGLIGLRARCSTYSSGTASVTVQSAQYGGSSGGGGGSVSGTVKIEGTDGSTIIGSPDPCITGTKSYIPINLTASGQLSAGTGGKKWYFCGVFIEPTFAATNIAIVTGTGTLCASGCSAPLGGGTTAATGYSLDIHNGTNMGTGGYSFAAGTVTGDNLYLLSSSGVNQISGVIVAVLQ